MVPIKPQDSNSRTIFHIDMDAFFASIEVARNPALRGKAVIVGGQPNTRGVVSTCSYEARKFGVHSAMSLTEAYRCCPHGIFLDGSFSLYRDYSERIMEIFASYTPSLEVVSVDEAYLDMTEVVKEFPTSEMLAKLIKKVVWEKTQLPCSIGIASNKLVAKIASSKAKPNGVFVVPCGQEAEFLAPLPIQAIPGIGEKTQVILNREGFKLVRDLQQLSLEEMTREYGSWGYYYYQACRGMDNRPVEEDTTPPKSIGADTTFEKDVTDLKLLRETLLELTEKVVRRMHKHKMRGGGVSVKLRYSNFKTVTRARSLFCHTNNLNTILEVILAQFEKHYQEGDLPLRLIGVGLEKLTDGYWQPTFWESR